jgi:FAD/FMN-containing dehydrogenase/Fe-S oxidoreductase
MITNLTFMKNLEDELRASVKGDLAFDLLTRHIYSVDSSIFEVLPLGIVTPYSLEDLKKTLEIAYAYRIPITVRGAATGITGGCLGEGLIIDQSKYLTHILAIDQKGEFVICEPGVVQDDLNHQLAAFGYRLGPDTSTGNRATLGGMLANNAAGARSLRFGTMLDHIEAVDVLLANGHYLTFGPLSKETWQKKLEQTDQEGMIYRTVQSMIDHQQELIEQHFPKIPRHVSGYPLDSLFKTDPPNLAQLFAGSEGTLGIVTQMKLRIVPKPRFLGLFLLFFSDLLEAFHPIPSLLTHHPLSLEIIDEQVIELGRASPSLRNQLDWLKDHPKALLILEVEGELIEEVTQKIEQIALETEQNNIGYAQKIIMDPKQMANVWALRKAGLGVLLSKRTYRRAIAFLEDLSLPPHQLASFVEKFSNYLEKHGKQAGIYGHAGAGCLHIRPYIDLRNPEELSFMRQMMLDISSLVLEYGGALSGEHGDGLIRSWLNPKMFGEKVIQLFKQLKQAFDPLGLMNPNKIIPLNEQWENLRLSPKSVIKEIPTFLDFTAEGGLALAADLCNGNGQCRKKEGVMCPSYQVTRDDFHTTRARAQALRSIIHGQLPLKDLTSQGMHDVMDLCISCKGCKTECPSQVDMAKMKSEFLYHYQQEHGTPLRSYIFGSIGRLNWWMAGLPRVFNWLNQTKSVKNLLAKIGISPDRPLPLVTTQRFSVWFKQHLQPILSKKVILFLDTFTEFNHPSIGQAAVHLLNALGYEVILSSWSCCGRPALSKGLLKQAQVQAISLLNQLINSNNSHLKIIGLEPSCLLTLKDDYEGLIGKNSELFQALKKVQENCLLLDEFLAQEIQSSKWTTLFKNSVQKIKVHGHCYQKALVGMKPTLEVLRAMPGFQVEEIPSGCCGMAGSFGYEKEHAAISLKIGELILFPALRQTPQDTWIIANGMSCRHQIQEGVQRPVYHLAEALAFRLKNQSI